MLLPEFPFQADRMADSVQQLLEEMVPELQELAEHDILSKVSLSRVGSLLFSTAVHQM